MNNNKKNKHLLEDGYPHVDPVVWLNPAVGAQRVLYVLHLGEGRRKGTKNIQQKKGEMKGKGGIIQPCHMTTAAVARCVHLGGVLLQHADGVRIKGRGLCLQVGDGAVGLDGQDGVGRRHVHRVLDVGGAAVLQLHLLQAALVIGICSGKNRDLDNCSPAG